MSYEQLLVNLSCQFKKKKAKQIDLKHLQDRFHAQINNNSAVIRHTRTSNDCLYQYTYHLFSNRVNHLTLCFLLLRLHANFL